VFHRVVVREREDLGIELLSHLPLADQDVILDLDCVRLENLPSGASYLLVSYHRNDLRY
jgi:hypothetical protein